MTFTKMTAYTALTNTMMACMFAMGGDTPRANVMASVALGNLFATVIVGLVEWAVQQRLAREAK